MPWFPGAILAFALASLLAGRTHAQPAAQVIDAAMHHLGDSEIKDWPGIDSKPEGPGLKLDFQAAANPAPVTLRLKQRDVDAAWKLKVNGVPLGELRRHRPEKLLHYELPPGALRDGANTLELAPDNKTDDIAVGEFALVPLPLRELLQLRPLQVQVVDEADGRPLPARIAIERMDGSIPEVYFANSDRVALREGLLYVHGGAGFELPAGQYRVAATRGMEWSRAVQTVELAAAPATVLLKLRREVDTTGFVAADTHIHTYSLSGHGDATVDERMFSLAGEGVELAVATDHNHNTDYRPHQEKLALNDFFTPVTGNEVTTASGHFNGFPLKPDDRVPMFLETNWVRVVEEIRLRGAKVVILNHPRWPQIDDSPFGNFGLNRATGDRASGTAFTFDAMELVNSTVDTPDPLFLFTDWFALLNAGEKIAAVGSSDSHTVGDPVGQGRTYIPSATDDPARLDVDALCEQLRQGRTTISLGIFSSVDVNGQFKPGDLVPVEDGQVRVSLRVAAAGWIRPRRALLFLNGAQVAEQAVPTADGRATDARLDFVLPVRGLDAYLVCVVLGDPVKLHGWKTLNEYTLAATNPVFLDANRDGKFASPRAEAERILVSAGREVEAFVATVEIVPPPVGVQMLALAADRFKGVEQARVDQVVSRLAEREPAFALYLREREARKRAAPAPPAN